MSDLLGWYASVTPVAMSARGGRRAVTGVAVIAVALLTPACTVNQESEVATYRALLDKDAPKERIEAPAQREPLTIHKKCRAVAESAMRWDRRQRENAAPTPVI